MTRPTVLDMDLVVVPAKADVVMLGAWHRYKNGHHWSDEEPPRDTSDVGAYSAMLSASPYPTAWDDVRKYVEKLEVEAKCDEEYLDLVKGKYRAAEARIAELEERVKRMNTSCVPIHADRTHVFIDGRGDVAVDLDGILTNRISELEAALDEKEVASGLTSNGNLWRFWSTKASALAVRNAELEKLLADAERVIEPFAKRAGKLDGIWKDHETQWSPADGSTEITIGNLRAASAFADKLGSRE